MQGGNLLGYLCGYCGAGSGKETGSHIYQYERTACDDQERQKIGSGQTFRIEKKQNKRKRFSVYCLYIRHDRKEQRIVYRNNDISSAHHRKPGQNPSIAIFPKHCHMTVSNAHAKGHFAMRTFFARQICAYAQIPTQRSRKFWTRNNLQWITQFGKIFLKRNRSTMYMQGANMRRKRLCWKRWRTDCMQTLCVWGIWQVCTVMLHTSRGIDYHTNFPGKLLIFLSIQIHIRRQGKNILWGCWFYESKQDSCKEQSQNRYNALCHRDWQSVSHRSHGFFRFSSASCRSNFPTGLIYSAAT